MANAASEIAKLEIAVVATGVDQADRGLAGLERRNERVERAVERRRRAEERAARDLVRNLQAYRQAASIIAAFEAANRALGGSAGSTTAALNRQRAAVAALAQQTKAAAVQQQAANVGAVRAAALLSGHAQAANANTRAVTAGAAAARGAANDNSSLGASLLTLRSALIGLGIGRAVAEFVSMADAANLLEGRLRLVTGGSAELAAVQDELFAIAQRTRTGFESTADLYARVARNAGELGRSQSELLAFTEAVTKAIQTSGASAAEASSGVVQLSQALAAGELRGDEFRSVMENLPGVARALAQGLGVPIGALRQMAADGKLTADQVITAILAMRESIDRDFAAVPKTVGQSFTVLRNELFRAVAEMDKTTGVTGRLSSGVLALAGNLDVVGKAAGALAASGGFLALVRVGTVLAGVTVTVTGAFVAAAAAIVGALTAVYLFRDEIRPLSGSIATLGDFATAAFQSIQRAAEELAPVLGDLFSPEKARADFAAAIATIVGGFTAARTVVIDFVNAVINAFRSVVPVVTAAGSAISAALTAAFTEGLTLAVAFRQDLAEALDGDLAFDKLEAAADGAFGRISDAATRDFAGLADTLTDVWSSQPVQEALQPIADAVTGFVDDWRQQAELIRETSDLLEIWGVKLEAVGLATTKTAKATQSLTKEQRNAFRSAKEAIDELEREAKFAEAVAAATQLGALAVAKEQLAHKKAEAVLKIRLGLKHQDLDLTEAQIEAIERFIERTETANRATAAGEALRDTREELEHQKALALAYGEGGEAVRRANVEFEIRKRLASLNITAESDLGRQIAETTRQLSEQERATTLIHDSWRELTDFLGQAFDRIGSAITTAFATGEISAIRFGDIARATVSEVIQWFLKLSLINPLKNALEGGGTLPTLGSVAGTVGQSAAGSIFGDILSPITSAISSGFSSVSSYLFGTAAVDLSGGLGAITTAGTPGLFGTFGSASLSGILGGAGLGFGAGSLLNMLAGGNSTGGMIGSGGGALAGALIGSVVPGIGTILGGLLGGAGGGLLGGLFGPGKSVGPTGVARLPAVIGDSEIALTTDNGGNTDQVEAVAEQIRALSTAAAEQFRAFGSRNFGLDVGGFEDGFNLKEIVDGTLASQDFATGLDAEAAVTEGVRKTLQRAFDGFAQAEVSTALEKSAADTVEELLADLDFARVLGTFADGGITAVQELQRPLTGVEQAFRDLSKATEEGKQKATELGLSVQVATEYFAALRTELTEQTQESFDRRIREARGEGVYNQIDDLLTQRGLDARSAQAAGLDVNANAGVLFDASLRQALSGASLADLTRIQASGNVTDAQAQGVVNALIAEQALAAARDIEAAAMQRQAEATREQIEGLEDLADRSRDFARAANDNARALRQAAAGFQTNRDLSILSPLGQLDEARRQFETAFAAANDNDPTDQASQQAIDRLPTLSEQLLQASKAYYSTNSQYVADYTRVQQALANTASRQESIEQQQLTALQAIEARIVELGGTLASTSGPRYVQGENGQFVSTGSGGLPAGLDLGYDAERNIKIFAAYQAAGATYRGAGEGQIGQDRAGNPALNQILSAMGYADGGMVAGGVPGRDSVLAALTPGERVLTVDQNAIFERMAANQNGWGPVVYAINRLEAMFEDVANDSEELNDKVERLITVTYSTGSATAEGVRQGNEQRGRMVGNAERDAARPAGRKVSV